ncbi:arrestin [Beauveria brongniartii RCEF 3172]|uniref:Arrestin n=1 Tax=Beauveria brongniartii RCEF 3172 TaxID=1081107 RepID=A0A166ZD84_9HYPO|nr:arrestin [Beauveria brongniartii RCEF 3172]
MRLSDKARAAVAAPNVRSKAHRGRSGADARIDIHITNHYAAKIYTTGDSITGAAVIRVPRDTPFDRVVIQFAGVAATRNYMMPEIDQVLHHFLLLDMPPVSKATATTTTTTTTPPLLLLPSDRILRAGRTYTLPFHFVVPERLPLGACSHRCEHPSVREHHLRLPPSTRAWGDRDDASPETARVQYCVSASVLQRSVFAPSEPVSVLRGYHEVNVLPVHAEDAPLDVGRGGGGADKGQEYKLTSSKVLRKSLVSRKIGTVTVEAAQPSAVVISSDARQVSRTRIALKLAFFPTAARKDGGGGGGGGGGSSSLSSSLPSSSSSFPGAADSEEALLPTVHSITAKLVAKTYYNTSHMGAFPDRDRRNELNFGASMYYTDTSRTTEVQFDRDEGWQRVVVVHNQNQAADHHQSSSGAWAMALDTGFQLPVDRKKILLPTFHSCLLSRTYTLRLALSVGPGRITVALSVPLQVIVEPGIGTVPRPPLDAVSGRQGIDAALPRYKDHLFVQRRYDDDINTLIPPGIGIIM